MVNLVATSAILVAATFGFISAQSGSKDLFKCREMCYEKFVNEWHRCMNYDDCKTMCITPPNINSYIPEAFSFLCWNSCDENLGPFPLSINSASRQGSLVLTDIAWDQAVTNASKQCLVTWEVSGGGLMGNLLTDSSTVELSLWPDTVYHVQVTCKNKETGGMRRSNKLIVDTRKLNAGTIVPAIGMDTGVKNIYSTEVASSETEDRMKILKDSSKDFTSSYNPSPARNNKINHNKPMSADRDIQTNEISVRTESILRSKLASAIPVSETEEVISRSIVYAMAGAFVLFFGLVALYMCTRPRKQCPASTDKEELLVHKEALTTRTLHV